MKNSITPYLPEEIANVVKDRLVNFTAEDILDNVYPVLISREYSETLPEDVTRDEFNGMFIIYKIVLWHTDDKEKIIIKITNSLLKGFGIEHDELNEAAFDNFDNKEFTIVPLQRVIECLMSHKEDCISIYDSIGNVDILNNDDIYVITNMDRMHGATILFKEDLLERVAKCMGTDIYILPSSVHEILVVSTESPFAEGGVEELRDMVTLINGSEVSLEERLGNFVMLYSLDKKELSIA